MNKFSKLMIMFSLVPVIMFAQGGRGGRNNPAIKQQIDDLRKNTYTQVLVLTDAEAQKFWPVFDQMQAEMDGIRKQSNEVRKDIKNNYATITDADMSKKIDQLLDYEQQMLDVKKKYYAQFKTVLPIKKVALIPKAEREFKKALIEKIKQNRGPDDGE